MDTKPRTWVLRFVRAIAVFAYVVFTAYVAILSIAFALQLLGVDGTGSFSGWVYRSADRIMEPFRGLFPRDDYDGRAVFDGAMLFAILVYSMIGALIGYGADRVTARLENDDRAAVPPTWPPPPPNVAE